MPSDIELLRDDIYIRFLASLKTKIVNRAVIWATNDLHLRGTVLGPDLHQTNTFFSTAVWGSRHDLEDKDGLQDWKVMKNGESRFTLGREEGSLAHLDLYTTGRADIEVSQLSQASSIFHTLGISLDGDLSGYDLIVPDLSLKGGYLSDCPEARQRRRQQPVYLFVHPPDSSTPTESCTTSFCHHWSFDPTGQPPLSTKTCDLLGLPVQLYLTVNKPIPSAWGSTNYKLIHEYQLARGFDRTTSDIAGSPGYPGFEVRHDSSRFEDVSDGAFTGMTVKSNEDIHAVKPAAPQKSQPVPAKKGVSTPQEHAHRIASQPTVFSPSSFATNSGTRRPGGPAATTSRAPPSPPRTRSHSPQRFQRPPVKASAISSTHQVVARADDARSESTPTKAVSVPSKAPVVATQRQSPPPSKPVNSQSPPSKPRALQSAAVTSVSTQKATTSSSTSISSRPQTKPGPTRKAGLSTGQPSSGGGAEGTIGNRGTPNATEISSNNIKQRRTPAVSIPTRLANNHERTSSTSKRVWR
ncbi:hypothetical protein V5O48_010292 [Marasmius crinis-equi]|uniref:Uncharacterized protein n=1 Tax=Marasmius crinis-equi TaxID=585013 RepID=A0ABR3F996_9AGAR